MRIPLIPLLWFIGSLAGCASQSAQPVEILDERSGVTVAALKEAIELVPGSQNTPDPPNSALNSPKRTSFAYLGPVEWNRSGVISYGLWIHIAPGNDRRVGDIHVSAALTLILDDGPLTLSLSETPRLGGDPYREAVSWGQTAYFDLDVAALRRLAASRTLELDVRAADGSMIGFSPTRDARSALVRYLQARGITGD